MLRSALSCLLTLLFSALALGQTKVVGPYRDVRLAAVYEKRIPVWSGAALITMSGNDSSSPVVQPFDSQGVPLAMGVVSIPGAVKTHVQAAALGAGGILAVCGWAVDDKGHYGGFISTMTPYRETVRVIRTSPYFPDMVAIASDGTVWTKGWEIGRGSEGAMIIRHFDVSGNLLNGYIPQRSFPQDELKSPGETIGGFAYSSGRLGWYQGWSSSYYEIVDGKVQAYPGVSRHGADVVWGLAIKDNGQVFISAGPINQAVKVLYVLDRTQKVWQPVQLPDVAGKLANTNHLYGGYGNTLVLGTKDLFTIRFVD